MEKSTKGELLGGVVIIIGILTGTIIFMIPVIIIALIWMYASGRG